MDDKIYISWDEFHSDCLQLAQKIKASNHLFQKIIAVSRGGLLPAGILAYALDIRNCEAVNMASYDGVGQRREDGEVELSAAIEADAHTLIVDDLADSGRTVKLLRQIYPQAIFATVYAKPAGEAETDLFARSLPDQWVVFPWD